MAKVLPFIHLTWPRSAKGDDVSAADWRYQIHVRKYVIYSRVLLRHFSGLEILVEHRSLYDFWTKEKKIGEKENWSFEENAR